MYFLGDILHWRNFKMQYDNTVKDRYFIYLGDNKYQSYSINSYTVTTTTQSQYYQNDNQRSHLKHFVIPGGSFGFPCDSIVDVDTWFMDFYMDTLLQSSSIKKVGKLDEETLLKLYKLIKNSTRVAYQMKIDIYECYYKEGLKVEKPRRKKRGKYRN